MPRRWLSVKQRLPVHIGNDLVLTGYVDFTSYDAKG